MENLVSDLVGGIDKLLNRVIVLKNTASPGRTDEERSLPRVTPSARPDSRNSREGPPPSRC